MSREDAYVCGVCGKRYKTRRMFYVCSYCTAVTCKLCVGKGCNTWEREEAKDRKFLSLVGQIGRLEVLGFDMGEWKK